VCASVGLCTSPDSRDAKKKTKPSASSVATARRLLAEKHGIKVAFEETGAGVGGAIACNTVGLYKLNIRSWLGESAWFQPLSV
jgi:hypothetical protein